MPSFKDAATPADVADGGGVTGYAATGSSPRARGVLQNSTCVLSPYVGVRLPVRTALLQNKRVEAFDPDRVFKLIRKAGSQGAEIVVIDLCLDTVSLDAALEKAAKAVRLGFVEEGHVIVLDWNSEEHVV